MKKILSTVTAALAAIAITGCTSLAPGAEKISLTKDPKVVANCKVAGEVAVPTGTITPSTELKNQALIRGADTVFVTQSNLDGPLKGIAYNCSGSDSRQPVPVTKPQ